MKLNYNKPFVETSAKVKGLSPGKNISVKCDDGAWYIAKITSLDDDGNATIQYRSDKSREKLNLKESTIRELTNKELESIGNLRDMSPAARRKAVNARNKK